MRWLVAGTGITLFLLIAMAAFSQISSDLQNKENKTFDDIICKNENYSVVCYGNCVAGDGRISKFVPEMKVKILFSKEEIEFCKNKNPCLSKNFKYDIVDGVIVINTRKVINGERSGEFIDSRVFYIRNESLAFVRHDLYAMPMYCTERFVSR